MTIHNFWERRVQAPSLLLCKMIPQTNMKFLVLVLILMWVLMAFLLFTARSTVYIGSPVQHNSGSIWEQNPELCRNPQHQALLNESDYNDLSGLSTVRMGKVSVLYGEPNPTYERALRTHEVHNRIHGLREFVLREQIVDGVWNKPAYILSVLMDELQKEEEKTTKRDGDERLEWLLWVDGDTVVLNPCVPPTKFLPPDPGVHVVVSNDANGLNNGIFLLRVNAWSLELFAGIVGFRYYRPDEPLTFNDQSAMEKLLQEEKFRRHVAYVPQRWFNAYHALQNETLEPDRIRRGDFLVHFAGRWDRKREMEYWLDIAERHAPDWELEFYRTGYPEEIVDFWNAWLRNKDIGANA